MLAAIIIRSVSAASDSIRFVVGSTTGHGISCTTTRRRHLLPSINASRWETSTVHCLFQDARNLLGQGSMFGGRTTTKRFLQVIGNVCSNENTFSISHLWSSAPLLSMSTLQLVNRSVSRILYPDVYRDGDHSSRPVVANGLKRPTRRSFPISQDWAGRP